MDNVSSEEYVNRMINLSNKYPNYQCKFIIWYYVETKISTLLTEKNIEHKQYHGINYDSYAEDVYDDCPSDEFKDNYVNCTKSYDKISDEIPVPIPISEEINGIFNIDPNNKQYLNKPIYLDSHGSYITIHKIPNQLINYTLQEFDNMYKLHPSKKLWT